jgi:hypothetical protein
LGLPLLWLPVRATADGVRVALWQAGLSRAGPGLLLRDAKRDDPQVVAVQTMLNAAGADVLVLLEVDWDARLAGLAAVNAGLVRPYPHLFALAPNAGLATGLDMDGDGRTGGPRDAQGYGRFAGHGGMAVLSRYPTGAAQDFSTLLWRDLPEAALPLQEGAPFPSAAAQAVQRLASVGQWAVPVDTPAGRLHLLISHPTPPIFDGPEDRNGLRNHDEIRFWSLFLEGGIGTPDGAPVLLTEAGLDPGRDQHRPQALRALLADARLQDPLPGTTTTEWNGVGPVRSSFILPAATLQVTGAGVIPGGDASRHALVWVDLVP